MTIRYYKGPTPERGQLWRHVKTDGTYMIEGFSHNTITDRIDVVYRPYAHESVHPRFTRQLRGHAKSFLAMDGDNPRFEFVGAVSREIANQHLSQAESDDA